MNFFLNPPTIIPGEHLSPADAQKVAGIRLNSPPSVWQDEVVQNLIREHPFIPPDRVIVNFKKKDDAQGTAFGYVGIANAPHISIPIVIRQRDLAPMDVLIVRSTNDTGTDQGIGDMTEDKVQPLTEETFAQALDTGSIGEPVSEMKTRNTGYTEDGSALRLPFRGRTVIASVMGASPERLEEFKNALAMNKEAQAGFVIHGGSEEVIDSWLGAAVPVNLIRTKLASQEIKRATARVLQELPHDVDIADFSAGVVFLAGGATKAAASFEAIDLANPTKGMQRYLVYEDGGYSRAPEKVATYQGARAPETILSEIFAKCASGSLRTDMVVSFVLPDNVLSAPSKIASVVTNDQQNTINVRMLDSMMRSYNVMLSPAIKTAVLDQTTATWLIPSNCQVLSFAGFNEEPPMAIDKVAQIVNESLPDEIICSGGQFTLSIGGDALCSQSNEAKVASVLNLWFENGPALLEMVKEAATQNTIGAGSIRFSSDMNDRVRDVAKYATGFNMYPELARKAVERIAIPMKMAVKLAASIGSPEGVDAILSAGFLNEDNLAEFVGLSDEFDEAVSKLARLLLAIRMGFPGDESATMVAMKALQRVTERLKSAVQEVGM